MIRKVFISHKNTGDSIKASNYVYDYLKEKGYNPFFDKESLEVGKDWHSSILSDLTTSDVVIVIVDEETVNSPWVQREVDMAKALGISILPIILNNFSEVKSAFEKFDITRIQYTEYVGTPKKKREAFLEEVKNGVDVLAKMTYDAQAIIWQSWKDRNKVVKTPGKRNPNAAIFTHPEIENIRFHIATGDASLVKGFDALVNTENNYMQMARFFEVNTLSYAIRTNGAYFEDGEILTEDTIQNELYRNAQSKGGLPIRDRRILVTSAGRDLSRMQRVTNYRYIFHAAAVRIRLEDRKVEPVDHVQKLITNCIQKIAKIDSANGAIELKDDGYLIKPVENYKAIASILFPQFGAGEGGKPLEESAEQIVKCFANQVPIAIEEFNLKVNKIGLSTFFEEDVEIVGSVFRKHGFVEFVED